MENINDRSFVIRNWIKKSLGREREQHLKRPIETTAAGMSMTP
jgi:hypothetical protein